MKLEQGQIWKKGDEYFRIVKWSRTAIAYKVITDLVLKKGDVHEVTKKEFCRLVKGAELLANDKTLAAAPEDNAESPDAI